METRTKQGLRVVNAEIYQEDMDRYTLRVDDPYAPACPYGHQRRYIGYDNLTKEYLRFTKSVLLKSIGKIGQNN